MATDQLRHETADAICALLRARVEAERSPVDPVELVPAHMRRVVARAALDGRGAVIAALDESIELAAWALARAKSAQVIPFPVPHVAVARAV